MGTEESKGRGRRREWGERRRVRCGESVRAETETGREKRKKKKLHKVRPRGTVP